MNPYEYPDLMAHLQAFDDDFGYYLQLPNVDTNVVTTVPDYLDPDPSFEDFVPNNEDYANEEQGDPSVGGLPWYVS